MSLTLTAICVVALCLLIAMRILVFNPYLVCSRLFSTFVIPPSRIR